MLEIWWQIRFSHAACSPDENSKSAHHVLRICITYRSIQVNCKAFVRPFSLGGRANVQCPIGVCLCGFLFSFQSHFILSHTAVRCVYQ